MLEDGDMAKSRATSYKVVKDVIVNGVVGLRDNLR